MPKCIALFLLYKNIFSPRRLLASPQMKPALLRHQQRGNPVSQGTKKAAPFSDRPA
jgi:hypothetical protein